MQASRDTSTATRLPPSKRGHRHSPAPTTGHHSARRKVTNFLLIPPRASLFRPPSSWGIALMAFSPGRVCRERAESTCVQREHAISARRECARGCARSMQREHSSTAQGKQARSVQEGTWGVHAGCMGQARGCAASVHAVCKERMHRACKRTCGAHGENACGACS